MLNKCLTYGIGLMVLSVFSINTLSAAATSYGNNDGKKKKAIVTTSHGLVVKQSKPNMYVRFFNKVYNKYASKPVPRGKELPTYNKYRNTLSHTK